MSIEMFDRVKSETSRFGSGFTGVLLIAGMLVAVTPGWASGSGKAAKSAGEHTTTTNAKGVDSEYVIGPSDVLAVNVWKDTEISRTVLVRPDGKISLPLVGELEVSGLTALKVQELIAQKLDTYISKPQVTVIVTEVKSRTYVVVGKIAHSGSFELAKPTTILEAIAIAGGFLDFAKVSKIYVIRRTADGSQTRLPFDYKKVLNGRKADENIDLQSGDTVVVP